MTRLVVIHTTNGLVAPERPVPLQFASTFDTAGVAVSVTGVP